MNFELATAFPDACACCTVRLDVFICSLYSSKGGGVAAYLRLWLSCKLQSGGKGCACLEHCLCPLGGIHGQRSDCDMLCGVQQSFLCCVHMGVTKCLIHIGYSGDVWDEQPPPKDHPWHKFPVQAMTPHTSGTTLDAQVCDFLACACMNRDCLHRKCSGAVPVSVK